ncbi:hypothetical protein B0H13DRAFT_1918697 [Mycena leptocephala]|nr:hypothetical protein B0H13DRAFT_1918697 [Mycena leptocephala]
MFFSASIAFSFLVSLSGIAVYSAPVARQDGGRQVCTGADGTGTCVPIADGQCFNVAPGNAGSLIQFNEDDDCFGFPTTQEAPRFFPSLPHHPPPYPLPVVCAQCRELNFTHADRTRFRVPRHVSSSTDGCKRPGQLNVRNIGYALLQKSNGSSLHRRMAVTPDLRATTTIWWLPPQRLPFSVVRAAFEEQPGSYHHRLPLRAHIQQGCLPSDCLLLSPSRSWRLSDALIAVPCPTSLSQSLTPPATAIEHPQNPIQFLEFGRLRITVAVRFLLQYFSPPPSSITPTPCRHEFPRRAAALTIYFPGDQLLNGLRLNLTYGPARRPTGSGLFFES